MVRLMLPFALLGLCACQGPLGGVERLSDQQIAPEDGAVEIVAGAEGVDRVTNAEDLAAQAAVEDVTTKERTGFLGLLKRLSPEKSAESEAAEIALAGLVVEEAAQEEVSDEASEPLSDFGEDVAETPEPARRLPGLFGLLRKEPAQDAAPATRVGQPSEPTPAPKPQPRAAAKGPEKDMVPGTVMAFGNIGRICDLPQGQMGSRVAQYPERGAKYRIFDLAPDGMNSRTFYITGFDDGCARQVTGAMVMFGDVEMHEALRYGTAASIQPKSDADKAYDRVKGRVCKVGRNKPCGARIKALQRDTVFLSVYETFGNGGRWSNILLHDGQVEAAAMGAKPK
ncbi:hypothetical protein [Pseudooceanicola sp. MF1-13]|uniref:hypothetical protein n=1 Tax=Pseudooceanicola sp. MF1-13 TaxID=3379095 RepID=UPI0038917CDC